MNMYEMIFNQWWSYNIVMMCTIHDSMSPVRRAMWGGK